MNGDFVDSAGCEITSKKGTNQPGSLSLIRTFGHGLINYTSRSFESSMYVLKLFRFGYAKGHVGKHIDPLKNPYEKLLTFRR